MNMIILVLLFSIGAHAGSGVDPKLTCQGMGTHAFCSDGSVHPPYSKEELEGLGRGGAGGKPDNGGLVVLMNKKDVKFEAGNCGGNEDCLSKSIKPKTKYDFVCTTQSTSFGSSFQRCENGEAICYISGSGVSMECKFKK